MSSTAEDLVTLSGASLFLAAGVSFFYQPAFVTIILFMSAYFSTLYHESDEQMYITEDLIFAFMGFVLVFTMIIILAVKHGIFNYRVLIPLVFGIIAISFFLGGGSDFDETDNITPENYETYHSLWHIFTSLAAISVVVQDVDWSLVTKKFTDVRRGVFWKG